MPDKYLYEYAIIRLVPKVERGEFLNIGVILLSKGKDYLGMKYTIDEKRLKAFSEDIDVDLVQDYLHAWEKVCAGGSDGGRIGALEIRVRFRWLTANRSTIIQSSPVHPGFCTDPESALQKLFIKFVL
ncbi:MAG: DUF3037 domain-containing protein [Saprospiraceae bacterium]|nr:DUF3037 domain-containing protein [Saprospiraceae bacterium]